MDLPASFTPGRWRRRSAAVSSWVGGLFTGIAWAHAAAPLELSWQAPAECPTSAEVVQAVIRLLRDPPAEPHSAAVHIARGANGWDAELRSSGGVRRLSGETCAALTESVVVILALSIDPGADTSSTSLPPSEGSNSESSPALPVVVPEPQEAAGALGQSEKREVEAPRHAPASASRPLEVGGALHVFGELGIMPGPAFGGAVALRVQYGALSGEAGAIALLPQTGTLPDDASRGGHFSWFGGQLMGCLSPPLGMRLEGCVGGEAASLAGRGYGVDHEETRRALWLGPLVGLRAGARIASRAAFAGELALVVPVTRPTFGLEGFGEVHTPGPVSGRVGLGIFWR